jgi:hypothetical protein
MGLLTILALGFFLAACHATDSDHVVAVTAIVSRESRSAPQAWSARCGASGTRSPSCWSAEPSSLFGIVSSGARRAHYGVSVALMLVVLGVMNVVGFRHDVKKLRTGHAHPHQLSTQDEATIARQARGLGVAIAR